MCCVGMLVYYAHVYFMIGSVRVVSPLLNGQWVCVVPIVLMCKLADQTESCQRHPRNLCMEENNARDI